MSMATTRVTSGSRPRCSSRTRPRYPDAPVTATVVMRKRTYTLWDDRPSGFLRRDRHPEAAGRLVGAGAGAARVVQAPVLERAGELGARAAGRDRARVLRRSRRCR